MESQLVELAISEIAKEVKRSYDLYPEQFKNQHEAYAVILEELDELWAEIKKKGGAYDWDAQRKEAIQAAAMIVRLIAELL